MPWPLGVIGLGLIAGLGWLGFERGAFGPYFAGVVYEKDHMFSGANGWTAKRALGNLTFPADWVVVDADDPLRGTIPVDKVVVQKRGCPDLLSEGAAEFVFTGEGKGLGYRLALSGKKVAVERSTSDATTWRLAEEELDQLEPPLRKLGWLP